MLLYVTDALDAPERDELRAHLAAGCPACAGALAEAHATVAQLPQALPRIPPPPQARDRLMQRVLSDASSRRSMSGAASSARATGGVRWSRVWGTAASIAAIIGIAAALVYNIDARQAREKYAATLKDRDGEIAQLQSVARASQDAMKMLEASDLRMVSLEKKDPQPNARGRVLWDRDNNTWHVTVFDMTPPSPGKTYELWFITPQNKPIRAGLMTVDASGHGTMTVPVPKDIGPIAVAAFTDEPLGGVDAPTGVVQLAGKVQ
jgi:anti-sigma-K factor RskA